MLRPLTILALAQAACFAIGGAVAPSYAATNSDGVTVMTAPAQTAAPDTDQRLEQVNLSDGDTITAVAGSLIITRMDPKTGDFSTSVSAPGQ